MQVLGAWVIVLPNVVEVVEVNRFQDALFIQFERMDLGPSDVCMRPNQLNMGVFSVGILGRGRMEGCEAENLILSKVVNLPNRLDGSLLHGDGTFLRRTDWLVVGVDRENTSTPDKSLALVESVGLVLDSARSFHRLDSITIETPTVSTSERPPIFGSAFTTQDISMPSPTVHNIPEGVNGSVSQVFPSRIPRIQFSIHVLNLPTDSVKNICVSLGSHLILFLMQRCERVKALPLSGWSYF